MKNVSAIITGLAVVLVAIGVNANEPSSAATADKDSIKTTEELHKKTTEEVHKDVHKKKEDKKEDKKS